MSQTKEHDRVKSAIGEHVLSFFREHDGEEFTANQIARYVMARCDCAPSSVDRIMRSMKQSCEISYTLLSRSKSRYRAGAVNLESLCEHLTHHLTHEAKPLHRQTLCIEMERLGEASDKLPHAPRFEWSAALDELIERGRVSAAGERVAIVRECPKPKTEEQALLF